MGGSYHIYITITRRQTAPRPFLMAQKNTPEGVYIKKKKGPIQIEATELGASVLFELTH